jgi:NAD(P)-dependent dehydrogenase (short-subunit alcohol dehydrogenase family)
VSYTVSKHGVVGLTRNTAYLYAQKGIRCNAILPGAVATNIEKSMDMTKVSPWASERLQTSYGMIPSTLEPIDIANVALFLASDDARQVNGAIITADGGWRA